MKPNDFKLVSILVAQPTLTMEEAARLAVSQRTLSPTDKQSGRFQTRSTPPTLRTLYRRMVTASEWSN